MAYSCYNCGKGNWAGQRSQHHKGVAGGQWKHKAQKTSKLFRANLHSVKVMLDDSIKRIKLCTDCISLLRKNKQLNVSSGMVLRAAYVPHTSSTASA